MKKRKSKYMMTLVGLTCISVVGMLSMLPKEKAVLPFLTGVENEKDFTGAYLLGDSEEDFVIDDYAVDKFIEVYVKGIKDKEKIKNLTSLDKKEVRLILEDMGYNNTTRLKDVLYQDMDIQVEGTVKSILDENLFDYDFERLNMILGIE